MTNLIDGKFFNFQKKDLEIVFITDCSVWRKSSQSQHIAVSNLLRSMESKWSVVRPTQSNLKSDILQAISLLSPDY